MAVIKEKKNIPNGWQEKKLADVCHIVNGSTPSTSNSIYWNGEINWYTPNDLKHQKIVLDGSERKISDLGLQSIGSKVVPARSLILSTRAPIGYLGITETKTSFNQGCKGLIPKDDKLSEKFLYYNLFHQKKALNGLGSGSTFLELSSNNLASFEVLLPPIKEQQKIAEILGTVDEDIAKTQEVIKVAEKLKRGLMQHLFTRGIGHTKFKETKIGQIPEEWKEISLSKIIKLTSGKGLSKAKFVPGEFSVYGGNGVSGSHNEYILEKPTIIIGRVGEYCGAVHLTSPYSWVTDNALYIEKYLIKVNQFFLFYLLHFLNLNQYAKVGGQPSISQETVGRIQIRLPGEVEQQEIAEILSAVDEKISVNKKLKEKLTLLKKGLMHDLLSGKVRTI